MKLSICFLRAPLTLALGAALACSSSSNTSPSDDGGSPAVDSSIPLGSDSSAPQGDSSTPVDSSTPADSSTPVADSSTAPDSSAGEDAGDAGGLSFASAIYAPIIEHHCVGCHGYTADGGAGTGISFGKLDMSSVDAGYANLVNVPAAGAACASEGDAGLLRVVPGSAATSLLYEKVNGFTTAPPCGGAMPKSGEIPDGGQAIVVQQIGTWIDQGAAP